MRTAASVVFVAAALVACAVVPSARADGDPASDYLLTQQVFFPFDAKFPAEKQQQLTAVVTAANRAGYSIRVAVIWSSYDLGAITGLWRKPRTYARFLSAELEYVYKQRLLVVMPNGFGFNRPKHPAAAEYALLAKIPVHPEAAGLLAAARAAAIRPAAPPGGEGVPMPLAAPSHPDTHHRAV